MELNMEQYLADPNQNPEILLLASNLEQDKKQRIHKAISTLDKRSIDILQMQTSIYFHYLCECKRFEIFRRIINIFTSYET